MHAKVVRRSARETVVRDDGRHKEDAVTKATVGVRVFVLIALLLVPRLALAQAQESKSATLAIELAHLLDERKLDSVAAPQGTDRYVGALYVPGSQLLVVSGKYVAAARMTDLLTKKDYREVYLDLSSASEQQSRMFVMDLGANGLRFKREDNQPFDTADVAGKSFTFDGDWGRAKISEDDYRKAFTSTDQQYSEMLQALIAALKKTS
jgi:hypothetical protein